MKFFIAEGNLGDNSTPEQARQLINMLRDKGWTVEYGIGRNKATEVSEFGREEEIQDAFARDFMECLALMES